MGQSPESRCPSNEYVFERERPKWLFETGRLLVAHEAVKAGGFGAEIAATVAETLGVPVRRLGSPRVPIAYAPPMENALRVTPAMIAAAAREMLGVSPPQAQASGPT